MTTDAFRSAARCGASGVTLSAQAKGAGMIQPGFATMLCFVQTDAVLDDPEAALRPAVEASFERITVDGQMSTNDTVLLQASGGVRRPLPAGLLDAVLLQLAIEIVADGEGATRVGATGVQRGRRSRAEAERARGRSPTRRWSRPRSSAAIPTGAGSPRRRGWAWPVREMDELGLEQIDASELGARLDRGRDLPCDSVAATPAPTSSSRTSATSTCGSTRSTRREERDLSPERRPRASRRCSRPCPTSGSSTAARW